MNRSLLSEFPAFAPDNRRIFIEPLDRPSISYADTHARSAQIAHVLKVNGVKPGDRVAVQTEKSAETILLYLACLRVGAVYLPLNSAYTPVELAYFLGDAEPRLLVCAPEKRALLAPVAAGAGAGLLTLGGDGVSGSLLDQAAGQPTLFTDIARAPDDLAAILYTSGTTGRSKGAMLSHANLASNAGVLREEWGFTADDRLLHALPIFHTHGLFVATNTCMAAGASMLLLPRFDVDRIFAALPRATCMMGVPTFYVRLLQDERLTREATAHIRLFISGSAPLLAETHAGWRARAGHAILERYGMTETNMNTSNPYQGERRPGTVGFPLPGVDLRITDPESGQPLEQGAIGMIEVRGPNVFGGYWRMPEKTAAEFRADGFFITGDLGRIDVDGYVHIVGRGKDLVITGGFNVYPLEVESEIDAIAGVEESAVIGLPHADLGEAVTAIVRLAPGAALDEEAILALLQGRLARFKMPKRILFVDELPRNAMGKVQKNLLRETWATVYTG